MENCGSLVVFSSTLCKMFEIIGICVHIEMSEVHVYIALHTYIHTYNMHKCMCVV